MPKKSIQYLIRDFAFYDIKDIIHRIRLLKQILIIFDYNLPHSKAYLDTRTFKHL
jgi:hypothetical protein